MIQVREVLYNIVAEFGTVEKVFRLMYMYEWCNTDHIGKHLCDTFPLHGGEK